MLKASFLRSRKWPSHIFAFGYPTWVPRGEENDDIDAGANHESIRTS